MHDEVAPPSGRLPVVVVGAGGMGRAWLRMLRDSPVARCVGVVDLDLPLAQRAAAEEGLPDAVVGADLAAVLQRSGARAVVDVTVPQAHRPVNEQALRAGVPVLCEKPLAPTLSGALRQVALADVTGRLLVVSQSRRYFNRLAALRDARREAGPLAAITHEFFHADHEPGFREQMDHPLLIDMSIHHFDALRYVAEDEPVSVSCRTWNPPWSWYAGDAAAAAVFDLASGARYVYSGSRATPGLQNSFNGAWRVFAERGALHWDGEDVLQVDVPGLQTAVPDGEEGIAGAMADFVETLRTGRTPATEVRANVLSLAMVEAAIASSARGGATVVIADLLEEAYASALEEETAPDVLERLRSWGSARAGIATGHWGAAPAPEQQEKESA